MKQHLDVSYKNCILCKKETLHHIISSNPYDYEYDIKSAKHSIVRCDHCGLIMLYPIPTVNQLLKYYPNDYTNYGEEQSSLLRHILEKMYSESQIKLVKSLIGNTGKILDVGCATGKLIGLLEKNGEWKCYGIEFKNETAEIGRRAGRKIFTGTLENLNLDSASYDLVILNHMIEHAPEPLKLLKEVYRILKKNGRMYIETPNVDCIDFKIFKDKWGCVHYPRHTFIFSRKNILKSLSMVGFETGKISFSIHTCGWALGCQNILSKYFNLNKTYGRISIYPLLLLSFVPFTILQKLFGNASVMCVVGFKH